MSSQPPAARDYFLACYTVSLVQGETILGTPIQHSTIKNYLTAAHDLFGKLIYTSDHQFVHTILAAVKDYEDIPNRRRMITDSMMSWLLDQAEAAGQDSATRAIVDWILLGRYAGFRASEWSQTTLTKYARIDWPGSPSRAFTREDFGFLGHDERIIGTTELYDHFIRYLEIIWRKQKNGQNGQKVTFGDDPKNPRYSATRSSLRIYNRSIRLGMKAHEPMGVFKDERNKVKFITDTMVNSLLRDAARITLHLPPGHAELKLWSTHSIRVTAANLLYRQQLSDHYIMKRLRWMSSSYLVYLRNTIHSADAHSQAISIKLSDKDKQGASYREMNSVEHIVSACSQPAAQAA